MNMGGENMDGHLETFYDLLDFMDDIVKKICIFLAAAMTITVILQVLFRYILKNPLIWTEELARYLMIWMAFLGASSVLKRWEHVFVDYFLCKLPLNIFKAVDILIKSSMLIFLIYLFRLSIKVFPNVGMKQVTPALGLKMLWAQFGIILGLFLMIMQLTGVILKDVFKREEML